jgi:hypothetical protein
MDWAMPHRTVRGHIRYTSARPGHEGAIRGGEDFAFTHHADGRVTLQARCEIAEPEPTVLRHIVYSLDIHGRPQDCLVRLDVGGQFMGSGLISFDWEAGHVHCQSHGPSIGRIAQGMPIGAPLDGFGTHPIAGDAYLTRCMDVSKGPHRRPIRVLVPSPDHRGATPPMLAEVRIILEYAGDTRATCAAGTFDCHHFRFLDEEGPGMGGRTHPPYDLFVTADPDRLFVTGGVGGYMGTAYELVRLEPAA